MRERVPMSWLLVQGNTNKNVRNETTERHEKDYHRRKEDEVYRRRERACDDRKYNGKKGDSQSRPGTNE